MIADYGYFEENELGWKYQGIFITPLYWMPLRALPSVNEKEPLIFGHEGKDFLSARWEVYNGEKIGLKTYRILEIDISDCKLNMRDKINIKDDKVSWEVSFQDFVNLDHSSKSYVE